MTGEQYTSAGTLADHFEYWRERLDSDRAAAEQTRRRCNLPPGFKIIRISGKVMLDTPAGLFDAADIRLEAPRPASTRSPLRADLSLFTPKLEEPLYGEKGRGAAVELEVTDTSTPTTEQKSEAPATPFTHKKGITFYNGLVGKGLDRDGADRAARAHFGSDPMRKLLVAARRASKFNRERGRPPTKPR